MLNEITCNPWMWVALPVCSGLFLSAACVPSPARMLDLAGPAPRMHGIVVAMSIMLAFAGPIVLSLPNSL